MHTLSGSTAPLARATDKAPTSPAGRPIDQDCIAQRNVEAVFDNRRRDQNVGFVMHEFQHHFFQLPFTHLPMPHSNARLWSHGLNLGRNLPNRIDAVVDEINLAAAVQFLLNRRLDELSSQFATTV